MYEILIKYFDLIYRNLPFFLLATQSSIPDTQNHSYTAIGFYNLTVIVQGPTNIVTKTFPINVQNPVSTFNVNITNIGTSSDLIAYTGSKISFLCIDISNSI